MKKPVSSVLVIILLTGLISGCVRTPAVPPLATVTPPAQLTATSVHPVYSDPVDGIIATIEVSDPKSASYDPNSAAYAAFPQAVKQLAGVNSTDNNAASMLAYALTFPRPDSYLAAQALITLGPDTTSTTMPILFGSLLDPRARVRLYAVLALGTVGKNGSCAIGNIATRLWDTDPYVRSAAAAAVSRITGKALLQNGFAFTPQPLSADPVPADTPEGSISGAARKWWNEQGSKVNWHPSYDLCDP